MKNVLNDLQSPKNEVLDTTNCFKHVFSKLEISSKNFFLEFSAEISARGPKFLHLGGAHPFSALFSKKFEKFEKNRIFSIPSSCLDDAYLESCETLYFTKNRKKCPPVA